jgi:hypothetical protein
MRELQCREVQRTLGERSSLASPHQNSHTQLHHIKIQHPQPQAQQTYGKSFRTPVQQHLPQQEILSVQGPSLSNSEIIKVATVAQQTMTELREAVSGRDKIVVIKKNGT